MPGAQTTTACPSTSMPRRPARPVSWVYSPGVTSTCASPFHLTSRSSTTVRAGMLMPSARVSVANTALTRPRTKHSSTVSLNAGTRPAWWAASPASRPSRHSQKPRTCRSSSGSAPVRSSMICGDLGPLALVGQPQPGAQALLDGGVAAVAAEHEGDRRQQAGAVEPLDDVGARRRAVARPVPVPVAAAPPPRCRRPSCRSAARARARSGPARGRRPSCPARGWTARAAAPLLARVRGRPQARTGRTPGCRPACAATAAPAGPR